MFFPFILLIIVISLLLIEYIFIIRSVKRIKYRIHINGTRGKSSVTEYIAAALRCSGQNTIAKITGVRPTIFFSDRELSVIKRMGPARVQEQIKLIHLASTLKADSLVLECMSITPELQRFESRVFQPHIYVITNIRNDHREQMGKTIEEEVWSICSAIPKNSTVITCEKEYLNEIVSFASLSNSNVITVNHLDIAYSFQLPSGVFVSNVSLALKVCEVLGIEPKDSFQAIREYVSKKDSHLVELNIAGKKVNFLNGFAVNDVPSANDFIEYWQKQLGAFKELIVILNTRFDRPLRSIDFAKWLVEINNLNYVILVGTHVPKTRKILNQFGMQKNKIITWSSEQIQNFNLSLEKLASNNTVLIGIGNIAGDGFRILDVIKNTNNELRYR